MRCVVCVAKFEANRSDTKTCSEPCRVIRYRVLLRERYDKKRDAINKRSREYYYDKVRRKPKVRPCVACGERFESRWSAKTCLE